MCLQHADMIADVFGDPEQFIGRGNIGGHLVEGQRPLGNENVDWRVDVGSDVGVDALGEAHTKICPFYVHKAQEICRQRREVGQL